MKLVRCNYFTKIAAFQYETQFNSLDALSVKR